MRERIYQAAVDEILQRGLRFSMRDLASRLGASTKTLYTYFDSKEAIIGYIVNRSIQEMKEKEETIFADTALSLKQKLRSALVNLPQGIAFGRIHLLNDLQKFYPDQWRAVDEYLNHGWDSIRELMKEGISRKEFREFDVELFIRVYVGAMYQHMDTQAARNPYTLEHALSETAELLLSGIYRSESHEG